MKAIHGSLDLKNTYSFVSLDLCDDGFVCDNCGKPIKRVMTVKDNLGKSFDLGVDCGDALIEASSYFKGYKELIQAKKELAQRVKFNTFLNKKHIKTTLEYDCYNLFGSVDPDFAMYRIHSKMFDTLSEKEKALILSKMPVTVKPLYEGA